MKRLLQIAMMLSYTTISLAQITVDSLGNVGIGTTNTLSKLSVGNGNSNYYSMFMSPQNTNTMFIRSTGDATALFVQMFNTANSSNISRGISVVSNGHFTPQTSVVFQGSFGYSKKMNIGVAGVPYQTNLSAW